LNDKFEVKREIEVWNVKKTLLCFSL